MRRSDQILHLEVARTELADGESDAIQAAWRNDGGNAAAIGQPGIENGLYLGDVIA